MAELVACRPEGYPAGELYAALMPHVPTLAMFETLLAVLAKRDLVERRGDLLFAVGRAG